MNIENKWFRKESNCQDLTTPNIDSNGLGVDSFWVLFLLVAGASILSLIIFVVSFIYKHRDILTLETSIWSKIKEMLIVFNEKDLSCHAFNSNKQEDEVQGGLGDLTLPKSSVCHHLNQANSNSVSSGSGGQQAHSTDQASS